MNTTMWQHPATRRNLEKLRSDGVHILEPDAGEMACGTIGPGRLSEPDRIVARALAILETTQSRAAADLPSTGSRVDLQGERILITAGATREPIDPVRFISNRSSGQMGFALAEAAGKRGANVIVVAGTTTADAPTDIELIKVTSAEDMRSAVLGQIEEATILIAAAAVADYRPKKTEPAKIKKSNPTLTLELERTSDILGDVAHQRVRVLRRHAQDQLLIGFAAEANDILSNATAKLTSKKLDVIVANDVSRNDIGFDSPNNAVTILVRDGLQPIDLPVMSKLEIAHRILDEIVKLRHRSATAKTA